MAAYTPVILVHLVAAVAAVVTGGLALASKKGSAMHRLLGRSWVMLMAATALSSFGIRSDGGFSAIHILSVVVLVSLSASVYAAVRGRIGAHRRSMLGTYAGLLIAAAFTLLPGRLLGDLLWGTAGLA